jgi:hypothetical protein
MAAKTEGSRSLAKRLSIAPTVEYRSTAAVRSIVERSCEQSPPSVVSWPRAGWSLAEVIMVRVTG